MLEILVDTDYPAKGIQTPLGTFQKDLFHWVPVALKLSFS